MKNLLCIIFTLLFVSANIGCSENVIKEVKSIDEVAEFTILEDLGTFNETLMKSIDTETRAGFFKKLLKVCALVSADALGGYEGAKAGMIVGTFVNPGAGTVAGGVIGGLICGAGASYLAYDQCYGTRSLGYRDLIYNDPLIFYRGSNAISAAELQAIKTSSNVNVSIPLEYANAEIIALNHNAVLARVMNGEAFKTVKIDDEYAAAFSSPEFIKDYHKILDDISFSMMELGKIDVDKYFGHINPDLYSPISKSILELFMDIYTNYPSKMEDIDFVVNHYMQTINKSQEINVVEKEALFSGLAIAAYSPRLWETKIN